MPAKIIKVDRIDSDETKKALHGEVAAYINSDTLNAGFDLSQLTIIRSEQIGYLARAIKAADQRNGKVVLWVTQHALMQLLIAVHFDKKAAIVRTEIEFKELLETGAAPVGPASSAPGKPAAPAARGSVPAGDKVPRPGEYLASLFGRRSVQWGLGIAAGLLVLGLISLIFFSHLQGRALRETRQQTLDWNAAQERRIDSLMTVIRRYQEEEKLMNEIASDGKKEKDGNAK